MTASLTHQETAAAERFRTNLSAALCRLAGDPNARLAPGKTLPTLRTIVDVARSQIEAARAAGETDEAANTAAVRLTDAAVAGLLRFARSSVDLAATSMIAPVSCVAIGDYAVQPSTAPFAGGLLVLLEHRRYLRARGIAIAGFIAHGLADLGIEIETFAKTVDEAITLMRLPAFDRWLRQRRLIAGQSGLFAQFQSRAVCLVNGNHAGSPVHFGTSPPSRADRADFLATPKFSWPRRRV